MFEVKYEDNYGADVLKFETEELAVKTICDMMQKNYDSFLEKYPDKDVIWTNRLLDCGDITEIYIDDINEYCLMKILW